MRNLYARFILWLIQPALERHSCAGVAAPVWTLSSDGMLHIGDCNSQKRFLESAIGGRGSSTWRPSSPSGDRKKK